MSLFNRTVAATAASALLSAEAGAQEAAAEPVTDTPVEPVPEVLPADDADAVTPAADPSKDPLDGVVPEPDATPPNEEAPAVVAEAEAAPVLEAEAPVQEAPVEQTAEVTAEAPEAAAPATALESLEVAAEGEVQITAEAAAPVEQAAADVVQVEETPVAQEAAPITEEAPVVAEAEPVAQEATPVAELEQVADANASATLATESAAAADFTSVLGTIKRAASSKAPMVLVQTDRMAVLSRRTAELVNGLRSLEMVLNFTQVAKDHQLSAPVVAAFRATPGFEAALENFPATSLFNIVPEHASSASNQSGLESFNGATVTLTDDLKAKTQAVADGFATVLDNLGTTVDNLRAQIEDDKEALDASDITDEVMATLPVYTLSNDAFADVLTKLDENLRAIDLFDVEDLKAHPEKIPEEIKALAALVDDIGGVLGLSIGEYGLSEADKSADYEPTHGEFADKGITKSSLAFCLEKSGAILDALKVIADRKDDVVSAVSTAVADMPEAVESDDVTYGCVEHVMLLSCYATLVAKLVRESIVAVSMVLTAVDAVLDIDTGEDEDEASSEEAAAE